MSAGIDELIARLQSKRFAIDEVAGLAEEAAAALEGLRLELSRKESTVGTISHALSYAEKECARHRSNAQELENENRRLRLELDEARKESERLQEICGASYQLAGKADAPLRFLDVLANPLDATQEQIDSLLPVTEGELRARQPQG